MRLKAQFKKRKKQYVGFCDFGLSLKFSDHFLFPYFLNLHSILHFNFCIYFWNAFFSTCIYMYVSFYYACACECFAIEIQLVSNGRLLAWVVGVAVEVASHSSSSLLPSQAFPRKHVLYYASSLRGTNHDWFCWLQGIPCLEESPELLDWLLPRVSGVKWSGLVSWYIICLWTKNIWIIL